MKLVALMDLDCFRRLGCIMTASPEGARLRWRGRDVGYKFVIFGEGTIVVAPLINHSHVYGAFATRDMNDEAARAEIARIYDTPINYRAALCGAGTIHQNGTVMSWKSEAFSIGTPEYLRAEVETLIAQAFADGVLWRES